MFENSTKVIVISSSHTKGMGPRIGSIGYAAPFASNNRAFVPQKSQFINGLSAYPLKVAFIRYGYEKERPRYEIKKLIGVIPIIHELRNNSESEKIIRTFIEKLPRSNFDSHTWLKTKLHLLGKTDNVNVCVIVPTDKINSDLRTCSALELRAWFESFTSQAYAKTAIFRIVSNNSYIGKLPDKDIIYIGKNIKYYLQDPQDGGRFIDYVLKSAKKRKDLVKLIQMTKAVCSSEILTDHIEEISRLLMRNDCLYRKGADDTNRLLCKLVDHIFIDTVVNWKLTVLGKSKVVQNKGSIAVKIRKTKEVLKSIADEVSKK